MLARKLLLCTVAALASAALVVLAAPASAARGGAKADFVIAEGEEVRIGTWNIKFFYDHDNIDNKSDLGKQQTAPSKAKWDERVKLTAAAIAKMKPTLLGLQEIENKKVVEQLAKALKDDHNLEYDVGFIQGKDINTEQDVAFLAQKRPGTVVYQRYEQTGLGPVNSNLFNIPSKHLALTVAHTDTDGEVRRFTVIVAHLRATGNGAEAQRVRQSRLLNSWAKKLMGNGDAVIVLGDMNASKTFAQTTPASATGVLAGLETPNDPSDDLLDLNEHLTATKRKTHTGGKELDRIFVSPNLMDDRGLVFVKVENFRDLVVRGSGVDSGGTFYTRPLAEADLSDHYPLVATFKFVP